VPIDDAIPSVEPALVFKALNAVFNEPLDVQKKVLDNIKPMQRIRVTKDQKLPRPSIALLPLSYKIP
jgi:hypothetical protein